MAGGAAGEAILFIATIVIATAFVGVANGIVSEFQNGVQSRGDRVSDRLRSDVQIINDPEATTASPALIIYVKNTGDLTLSTVDLDVLLDGQVSQSVTIDVLGSANDNDMIPGEVAQITVNDLTASDGDHRIRVISDTGAEDTLAIRIAPGEGL